MRRDRLATSILGALGLGLTIRQEETRFTKNETPPLLLVSDFSVVRNSNGISITHNETFSTATLSYSQNDGSLLELGYETDCKCYLFFNRLFVAEKNRRKGIGKGLLKIVELNADVPILNTPNYYGQGDGQWYLDWLEKRGWQRLSNGAYIYERKK